MARMIDRYIRDEVADWSLGFGTDEYKLGAMRCLPVIEAVGGRRRFWKAFNASPRCSVHVHESSHCRDVD